MNKPSIPYQKAVEVLADGHWMDWDKAIYEISKRIPPNIAVHWAEIFRMRAHRSKNSPDQPIKPRVMHSTHDELVMYGARGLVRKTLMQTSKFEIGKVEETGQRLVRIRTAGVEPPPTQIKGTIVRVVTNPAKGVPLAHLSLAEQQEKLAARKALITQQTRKRYGLGPGDLSKKQIEDLKKKQRETMSAEEKYAINRARGFKSWETRKRKEEENGSISD